MNFQNLIIRFLTPHNSYVSAPTMFTFWWKAFRSAFGWMYAAIGVVLTIVPIGAGLLVRYFPSIGSHPFIATIAEYQIEGAVAIGVLFLVGYIAYGPYKQYRELADELELTKGEAQRWKNEVENKAPNFWGAVEHIKSMLAVDHGYPGGPKSEAYFFFIVTVRNLGSPSILEGWRMRIVRTGSADTIVQPRYVHEGYKLRDENGEEVINVAPGTILYEKLAPVPEGAKVSGWLHFATAPEFYDQMRNRLANFYIEFNDVRGRPYSIAVNSSPSPRDNDASPMFYPGVGKA